jgi:hypothetical protein
MTGGLYSENSLGTTAIGWGLITRRVIVFLPSSIARTIGVLKIIGISLISVSTSVYSMRRLLPAWFHKQGRLNSNRRTTHNAACYPRHRLIRYQIQFFSRRKTDTAKVLLLSFP